MLGTEKKRRGGKREIAAIKEMHMNIKAFGKVEFMRSKLFDVKVGVHQESVLSPLLFAVVIDEKTKNIRESVVKELFHVDNLALLVDSW